MPGAVCRVPCAVCRVSCAVCHVQCHVPCAMRTVCLPCAVCRMPSDGAGCASCSVRFTVLWQECPVMSDHPLQFFHHSRSSVLAVVWVLPDRSHLHRLGCRGDARSSSALICHGWRLARCPSAEYVVGCRCGRTVPSRQLATATADYSQPTLIRNRVRLGDDCLERESCGAAEGRQEEAAEVQQ